MTYEPFPEPDPNEDPTLHWLKEMLSTMGGDPADTPAGTDPPVGYFERPALVLSPDLHAAMAADEFVEEIVTTVGYDKYGNRHIATRRTVVDEEDGELVEETSNFIYEPHGPAPNVGDRARVYRATIGEMPRGLVIVEDSPDGPLERIQFYDTDAGHEARLEQQAARTKQKLHYEVHDREYRLRQLPSFMRTHVVLRAKLTDGDYTGSLLRAEQSMTLASHLPDARQLEVLQKAPLDTQLAALAQFLPVENWDKEQADDVIDMALFYLENR